MKKYFFIILVLTEIGICKAQNYKSFKVLDNGDTINIVDANNKKQGKWIVHIPELRVEPAYDEEGIYKNDKKEGTWRKYDMYGLLRAIENYKWGSKDGIQQYLYEGQLEHDESWRAVDPAKQYDTIEVVDPVDQFKVEKVIVKVESYSMEHGPWRFYDPSTGRVIRTINYFLGKEVKIGEQVAQATTDTVKPKVKPPKQVQEFEKSKKGKKTVIRDGATGY